MIQRRHRHRLNILALVAFTGYAVILLHPLWFYNETHVAGYDYFNYHWNFWWIRHAATYGLDVYQNNFVMFPAVSNYGYHALTAFWYPLWALLEPFIGTLTAVNVIITIACILNGFILFIWLRSEKVHPGLALLGGGVLQTLPITRYWYYNTHLNLMDWFWIPGLLLLWKHVYQASINSRAVGFRAFTRLMAWSTVFGVALWGLLMTDLQFPIFAAFVIAPYGVLTLWESLTAVGGGRVAVGRLFLGGVIAVATGLLLMWFAGPMPAIATFSGGLVPGPVEDRPGIAFPEGWLNMAERWWLWDQPSVSWFVTLGLLVSAGAALVPLAQTCVFPVPHKAEWRAGYHWFWLLAAIPPFVLAMGPQIHVGDATIPMPFVALYDFTDGNFRMPWRLAPAGVIAAATFVGLFWTPMFKEWKLRRKRAAPLITLIGAIVLLLSHTAVRLFETAPLDPLMPAYQTYGEMRSDGETYVVLDVPTGMGTGEVLLGNPRAIQYQWYGIFHEQRMVNGFISRTPIENFYYVDTDDALLSWLGQRRLLDPIAVRAQLQERIFEYPIGYIVLHTDEIARQSLTAAEEIGGYFNGLDDLLCPPTIEGAAMFYRTRWHPDGCESRTPREVAEGLFAIDIGAPEDQRYLGWGWHYAEPVGGIDWRWMGGTPQLANTAPDEEIDISGTTIYVSLPPGDYRMLVVGQAYAQRRKLQITINGQPLIEPLEFRPHELLEQFSEDFIAQENMPLVIEMRADSSISPQALGLGDDDRQLSVAIDLIRFDRMDSR